MKCEKRMTHDSWHFFGCPDEATWRWRVKGHNADWHYACAKHVRKSDWYYVRERLGAERS